MPSWGAVTWGVVVSAVLAAVATRFLLRERRPSVLATAAIAALLGPLLWNLILRHTGGDFFVDAPGRVFPVSLQDTGSGVSPPGSARSCSGSDPFAPPADAGLRSVRSCVAARRSSSTSTSTDTEGGKP